MRRFESPENLQYGTAHRSRAAWLVRRPGSSSAWARSMRLTGGLITLCALVACGEGRRASLTTPVLSYNGSNPFPAVIGESIALTPAVSGTVGHYTVSPPLPPGLSLDGQSGVISGTPTQASASAIYLVHASGAGVRASFPLVLSVTEPPNHFLTPTRPQVLWECPSGHGFHQSQAPSNAML